ncbi:MAG: F0F1 ATP synthase subunit delta [Inquilinus sp.]|nr:F0F1 ATP synthase subunit delta [Inquilinus sp.]
MASTDTATSGLASRYATALFELADEAKALDAVAGDLKGLKGLIGESADLRRLVFTPVLGRAEQGRAIAAVLEKAGAGALTRQFIGVVAGNRRLFALPAMIDAYLAELARRRGEVTAEVTAATALSDAQTAALVDGLKKAIGAKVSVDVTVDPSLLGGMIVKVGSRMVDSSLRTKLSKLQLAMKGVG